MQNEKRARQGAPAIEPRASARGRNNAADASGGVIPAPTPEPESCSGCRSPLQEHPDGYLVCRVCSTQEVIEYLRIDPAKVAETTATIARAGDTDAALRILQDFVGAIDQYDEHTWRGPIYFAHARYIAEAFGKVVRAHMRRSTWERRKWEDCEEGPAEADANIALGIKTLGAGRPPGVKTHNEEALAALYWYLRRRGLNPEKANELMREQIGCDRTTIQKAAGRGQHSAYKHPKLICDEVLKQAFEPYAKQAAAILKRAERPAHRSRRRQLRD